MTALLVNSMKSRLRQRALIVTAVVLSVSGLAALAVWRAFLSTPSLAEIRALAQAQQFAQAQAQLLRYLRADPQNGQAHLLIAEITTEPTNVQPEVALDHLRAIRPATPKQAALVKFFEGKARFQQKRYDLAERCWREALRLDPIVPEAGWALIDLLDKEGRLEEAHHLGMQLHETEPDPRDRIRILLEMSRLDIEAPEPLSQTVLFESMVKQHPENFPLAVTLGLALVRINRGEEGLSVLHDTLRRNPDLPAAWDAWLTGLYEASEFDKLVEEFARLPGGLVSDPRFAKHEGMIAQNAQDWPKAVRAYRRALAYEPHNQSVMYRLRFVLRIAGESAEFERIDRMYMAYKEAFRQLRGAYFESSDRNEDPNILQKDFKQTRGAYCEVLAIKTLGLKPHVELFQRLADLREKMGRFDEARAWHRLVLRDSDDNALSLAALERLK
jgi:tetratricopeptide (TPR) repeat protein